MPDKITPTKLIIKTTLAPIEFNIDESDNLFVEIKDEIVHIKKEDVKLLNHYLNKHLKS